MWPPYTTIRNEGVCGATILYLHQHFSTRAGASSTRSYEFAKYFVEQGHQTTIICGKYDVDTISLEKRGHLFSFGQIDGINIAVVNVPYSSHMPFWRRINSFLLFLLGACWLVLRLPKPNVILATSTPLTIAVPALLGRYLRGIPFVFEVRDLWPEVPIDLGILRNRAVKRLAYHLARAAYQHATTIVSLSPGITQGIQKYAIDPGKIALISNASDIDLFLPKQPPPHLKRQLNLRDNPFIVGYFGAMGLANGLDVIISAARTLQRLHQDKFVFLIAGDGPIKPRLEQLAKEAALENIIFLGAKPRHQMPDYLALAHVCLVLFAHYKSLENNSPNKLFDALAAGKPVVINKAGWMQELVNEHAIGIALPDCDGETLAQGLLKLSQQPDLLTHMGQGARQLAITQFDRRKLAETLLALLLQAARPN
jgi:glycosyltransferase involved in cell wall biosynthesis